jgi:hypothetical protein
MLVSWLWLLHGQSLAPGGEKYQACMHLVQHDQSIGVSFEKHIRISNPGAVTLDLQVQINRFRLALAASCLAKVVLPT